MAVWQRMLSGRRLDLLDPSPLDIEIADIAHGLARIARWNGQTSGTWAMSVAEHSLLVERIVALLAPDLGAEPRLAALLHDGHEYVVGDMIGPLKRATGARAPRTGGPAAGRGPRAVRPADQAAPGSPEAHPEHEPGVGPPRGRSRGRVFPCRGEDALGPAARPSGGRGTARASATSGRRGGLSLEVRGVVQRGRGTAAQRESPRSARIAPEECGSRGHGCPMTRAAMLRNLTLPAVPLTAATVYLLPPVPCWP